MKTIRMIALLGLGLSVSACAAVETTSRNAPFEQIPGNYVPLDQEFAATDNPAPVIVSRAAAAPAATPVAAPAADPAPFADPIVTPLAGPTNGLVSVNTITIRVPRSLKVSEANSYYPGGDIVWRGDPIGDRHAQVQTIFENAILDGVRPLNGRVGVDLDIQVRRFHALTEKARYTVGGLHSITFDLAIKDPKTGELLVPVRTIRADLDGFGGRQALRAEAQGQTQKVRISNHLSEVIRQELTNSDGYKNASLGFYQLVNSL